LDETSLSSTPSPSITVMPTTGRIDERVHIRLTGLQPHQQVTLHSQQSDESGKQWQAHAQFQADTTGIVDLDTQKPLTGTYDSPDSMGLFWSMTLDTAESFVTHFQKSTLSPISIKLDAISAGQSLTETTIERFVLAPNVDRIPVRAHGLAGTLFIPRQGGPYPAVIILAGSGGGVWEIPAAVLAAHGFACLALGYFAYEHLPPALANIPLEYFETALTWLKAHPHVDPERIGVMGTSRGGELALLLGATFPQIQAVVAYVPSNVLWEGFGRGIPAGATAWSYRGQPLPVIQERLDPEFVRVVAQQKPIAMTPLYHPTLDDATAVAAAVIPVEKSHAAILLVSGQDDQMWPSSRMAQMVIERLHHHNYPHPSIHLSYPNAGHRIEMPYLPASTTCGQHSINGELYAYGGTVAGNAFANSDSWEQILKFLHQYLR
jgi:dienelactone hydrolase